MDTVEPDPDRIQLRRTAFVIYDHQDLASAHAFLLDLVRMIAHETPNDKIFFRGYGEVTYVYVAK